MPPKISKTQKLQQLSARQRQILEVIEECQKRNGYAPSVREIAQMVGLKSASTVKHHLDILEKQGLLAREVGKPRTLDVKLGASQKTSGLNHKTVPIRENAKIIALPVGADNGDTTIVPLVGRIAAGEPITAEQHIEEVFSLPTSLTGHGSVFMLQVQGDSMVEAAICDGDYVVVRSQADAASGEIVVAMIDGEATVKVLSRQNGHQWLLPKNSNYAPISGDKATILGKVVTVIRTL